MKMNRRVAVFPAGTEIGLEINRALRYSKHIELIGFTSIRDHSEYVYKTFVEGLPFYSDVLFIDELNKHIKAKKIDFIFPAHDDVQLFLTENANKIRASILTTKLETVRLCRSKIKTYSYFAGHSFIPRVYEKGRVKNFPVFIKPDIGQGARGVRIINNENELEQAFQENPAIVICEYLPGEEYTIDCFTDFNGKLRVCTKRNRKRIKSGISVRSEILCLDEDVLRIANIINNELKFNGAWFFQLKKDIDNQYKLLEIAPRVSGTMGLSRNTGVNYPLLTIFNAMKIPVQIIENHFSIEVERALISRFQTNLKYETVYLDLDDTLIVDGKVNNFLMMFVYQALNNDNKIILISKHKANIYETLKNYKIPSEIFNEIIHIDENDEKFQYLSCEKSIFIDDSFSERYKVAKEKNIPVFDSSEVESLIDWRQ